MSVQRAVALLAGLSKDQAEAVALRVIAGLDTPDVARILGKSAGAIRVALHRGLKTLAADPSVQELAGAAASGSGGFPPVAGQSARRTGPDQTRWSLEEVD
jgi:RNA polymerase sigma-70 factor (ECF subfamily)